MSAQTPTPEVRERARLLVDRGLWLYGRGDVEGAMRHWLAACRADPKNTRAAGYVAFTSEHDGIDPRTIRIESEDLHLTPEPIGPPRKTDVPEWVPNPPPGAAEALASALRKEVDESLSLAEDGSAATPVETVAREAAAALHLETAAPAAVSPAASESTPEIEARWNPPQPPPDELNVTYKPRTTHDSGSFDAATVAIALAGVARPSRSDERAPVPSAADAPPAQKPVLTAVGGEAIAAGLRILREHLRADDFSSAVGAADRVLELAPHNEEAQRLRATATDRLSRILEAKIGDLHSVPVLRIPADEVIWLNLSHREGFILSQIDGVLRYEDILDVCGMPRFEALRVLAHLTRDKVIGPASPG